MMFPRYAVVDTKELSASYNLDIKLRVPMSGSADVIERKQVLMVVNNLCDGLDIYYLNPGSRRSVESGVKHIALAVPPDANYAYPVRFVQKGKCMAVGFANGRTLILEIGNPDPVQVLTQSDAGTGNVLTMDYWSNGQIEMLATATIGPQRAKLMIWSSQKVSKNIQVVNVEQNQGRTKRAAVSKHDRTPATIAYEIIWKSLALFLCLLTMLLAFDVDPFGVIPMFLSSVNAIGWRKATPVKDLDWSLDLEGTHWEDLSQTISVDSLYIPIATEQLPDQAEEVSSSQMEFLLTGDTTSLVAGLPTGTETVTVTITTLTVTNYDLGPVLSGLNIHLEKLISIIDDRIPKMTTESSKTPTTDSGMGRLDFWMNSIIPSRPLFIVVTAAFGGVAIVYWKMQKDGKDQGTNMRERDIGTALDKAGDAQIGKEGKKEFVWDVTEDEIGENRGMVNQAESAASAEAQFSSLTDVSNESILGKREADSGEAGAQD
ncbi:hypothetical protein VKT23_019199 [Stygiomarasmius scandens]|uniref:Uncharacterized protein n=1 Tax=Marasmiellus scandens TaxID=2682957 RepID=A0ABR1IQ39_9AGAR